MHCEDHFSISVFFFPLAVDSIALSMQFLCCESPRKKIHTHTHKKNPLFLFTTSKEWSFTQSCAVAVLTSPISAIQFISAPAQLHFAPKVCWADIATLRKGSKWKVDPCCRLLIIQPSQRVVHDILMLGFGTSPAATAWAFSSCGAQTEVGQDVVLQERSSAKHLLQPPPRASHKNFVCRDKILPCTRSSTCPPSPPNAGHPPPGSFSGEEQRGRSRMCQLGFCQPIYNTWTVSWLSMGTRQWIGVFHPGDLGTRQVCSTDEYF